MAHWTATGTPSGRARASADTASHVRVGPPLPDAREHVLARRRRVVRRSLGGLILQPAALPALHAAATPDARCGRYCGPTGAVELRGPLGFAEATASATDTQAAIRLRTVNEQLSGARAPSRLTD